MAYLVLDRVASLGVATVIESVSQGSSGQGSYLMVVHGEAGQELVHFFCLGFPFLSVSFVLGYFAFAVTACRQKRRPGVPDRLCAPSPGMQLYPHLSCEFNQ